MRKPYLLWCRNGVFYFKLRSGGGWHSTGERSEARALDVILKAERERGENVSDQVAGMTLSGYAQPFFIWETCPHCERIRGSGGQIGPEHVKLQRSILERFLIGNKDHKPDPLAALPVSKIKRGDCLDYRARLIKMLGVNVDDRTDSHGKRTVNAAMTVLSTIFSEGMERGELDVNPARRLTVKYHAGERATFTRLEMKKLFPAGVEDLGPWRDLSAKTAFLLAASTGMRRNEVRALRWQNVDLSAHVLRVHEAFKGQSRPGAPKWGKLRETRLTNGAARHLVALHHEEEDHDPVFHHLTGETVGTQWWEACFNEALAAA